MMTETLPAAPVDLHIHTHYSDGRMSPEEVVAEAAARGIRVMAITDHDNLEGSRAAAPLARAAGIELIPGIEITTRWPGMDLPPGDADVDLLGYFVNPDDDVFTAFTHALIGDLHARIASTCARLTARGYPVTMDDVFAQNPRYGGAVQLLKALLARGHAPTWELANQLLVSAWYEERRTPFTIQSAIQQIHLAGGVAVLAHPAIVRPRGQQLTAADLRPLVEAGLDGIEIYHRRLNEAARAHFLGLANEFGLLTSGGSDMHGWFNGRDGLGSQPVTEALVERLRARSGSQRGARIGSQRGARSEPKRRPRQ